jgi:hypothetical protein
LKKCDAGKRYRDLNPEPSRSLSLCSQPVVFDLFGKKPVIYLYEQFNFYNTKILFFSPFSPRSENEDGGRDVTRTSQILSWWNMDYVGAS